MSNTVRGDRRGNVGPGDWDLANDKSQSIPMNGSDPSLDILAKHALYGLWDCHGPDNAADSPAYQFSRENEEVLNILKIMSHDTRGPLIALGAALKLLKRGAYGKMDDRAGDVVGELFTVVEGLIGTLEDFLGRAFSVSEGLGISKEPLHFKQDIVEPVLMELSREIRVRSIKVENDLEDVPHHGLLLQGDRVWLRAIFRNLLRNAIEHGGEGCRIGIGFRSVGSLFRMNVRNTGLPVPEDYRSRLFTRFGRISSGDASRSGGMGLGLFLVRQIIERLGGHIWYEAEENGSNFIFTLPRFQSPSSL